MEKNIALKVEQMQHLKEIGLNTNDASMYWEYKADYDYSTYYNLDVFDFDAEMLEPKDVPAYTLQDILDKFDGYILYHFKNGTVVLQVVIGELQKEIKGKENELNIAYKMLCWCIENDYIKTK